MLDDYHSLSFSIFLMQKITTLVSILHLSFWTIEKYSVLVLLWWLIHIGSVKQPISIYFPYHVPFHKFRFVVLKPEVLFSSIEVCKKINPWYIFFK